MMSALLREGVFVVYLLREKIDGQGARMMINQ